HLGDTLKTRKGYVYWNTILRGGCSYFSYDIAHKGEITPHTEYLTDLITDNAIEFIDGYNDEKPFYLAVHYTAPHTPWDRSEHKEELWNLYSDADYSCVPNEKIHKDQIVHKYIGDTDEKRREWLTGYFASITGVDQSLQKIIDALNAKGILDDTVIIFTGDNGNNLGQHGVWGKGNGTYPQNMYEESIKVPFMMYNKKIIKPQEVTQLCSHVDIFPTILDLAGVEFNPSENMWGESLMKVTNNQVERNHVVVYDEYGAVRMVRNERYKFIKNYKTNEETFFDLEVDKTETTNVVGIKKYAEIVDSMRAEMEADFEKYTVKNSDARVFNNKGAGQKSKVDISSNAEAFIQDLKMYYEKK
ncbi:MAG: sulfatase-like hydrolase/transferase, partial [Clostridia bacterium]